jgi:hypothetical protein
MARLGRVEGEDLQQILMHLQAVAKSPLHAIAAQLQLCWIRRFVPVTQGGCRVRNFNSWSVIPVMYCTVCLRFSVRGLASTQSRLTPSPGDLGSDRFSGMLIPRYEQDWGHESVMMPAENGRSHIIDLILMPGQDRLRDVNLLLYPWLGHELAHNLLFRYDSFSWRCLAGNGEGRSEIESRRHRRSRNGPEQSNPKYRGVRPVLDPDSRSQELGTRDCGRLYRPVDFRTRLPGLL